MWEFIKEKGMTETLKPKPSITPVKMIVLGAGWFGANFFWGFHSASMPLFLRDFTNLKFKISLVLSLAGVTGCLVPPIVGYFSDRTRVRFGRRTPYIFIGMLGVLLCVASLPHMGAFAGVVLVAGMMYFFIGIAQVPYMSLLPDVTPPEQRSTASGVMNLLGSIGLIIYFLIGSGLWDKHPLAVFNIVAIVSFVPSLITISFIKEPKIPEREGPNGILLIEHIRGVVKETHAMRFLAAHFFWWLAFWMVTTFVTLFAVEVFKVKEGTSMLAPLTFSVVSTLMVLPLGMLGDRFNRKKILSCMIAFWAGVQILMALSQNFAHVLIVQGLGGIPFAAMMGVGYAFYLDLIPEERTAEFVGIYVISMAAPQIFGPMIGGKLIDVFGYRSIFPVASIFLLVGLVIFQFLRFTNITERNRIREYS